MKVENQPQQKEESLNRPLSKISQGVSSGGQNNYEQ